MKARSRHWVGERYRGFRVQPLTTGGYRCEHTPWQFYPDIPKSFVWTGPDKGELFLYLDALYQGDKARISEASARGFLSDVVPAPHAKPGKSILISWRAFIEALKGRGYCKVPLEDQLRFAVYRKDHTGPARLLTDEFAAGLLEIADDPFFDADTWEGASPEEVRKALEEHEQQTSVPAAGAKAAPIDPDLPTVPPRERTFLRRDFGTHVNWITQVIPESGQAWFVRRVYAADSGLLLYAASAWSREGPWTVYERNSSALLALGLDL